MTMEVNVGCKTAIVTILDSESVPIVEFRGVPVTGYSGLCGNGGFDAEFLANPGADFGDIR
jgi:hypothetical protein